ncbi:MAG: hypothetical protein PHE89_06710 [Alphaproteobacteria bacterium]|nr:hypothetical protein [Alphaproteobacteria bacterium]
MGQNKAVIEFGTNKWRVGVINPQGETVFYKDFSSKRNMVDSKIGEDYLFACLNDFSDELKKFDLDIKDKTDVRIIATEGFRDGENSADVIAKIKQKIGVEIEIISAKREAELFAKAIIADKEQQNNKNKLIVDMGGGSTDIALYSAKEKKVVGTLSLIGSRFLLEKLDKSKEFRDDVLKNEEENLQTQIEKFKKEVGFEAYAGELDVVTNTSSVMRILSKKAGHEKFLPEEVDGQKINSLELMLILQELSQMHPKDVYKRGYSGFKAAPQIVTGSFIFKETLAVFNLDKNQEVRASLKGPKEGLAGEMFNKNKSSKKRMDRIKSLKITLKGKTQSGSSDKKGNKQTLLKIMSVKKRISR